MGIDNSWVMEEEEEEEPEIVHVYLEVCRLVLNVVGMSRRALAQKVAPVSCSLDLWEAVLLAMVAMVGRFRSPTPATQQKAE